MMPWKESSAACEQRVFIERWSMGEESVSELCRRFGISRKTGYKRINRLEGVRVRRPGGPQQRAAFASERDEPGGGQAVDRGQASAADVGSQEAGGLAAS